jgi:hypothetical protein
MVAMLLHEFFPVPFFIAAQCRSLIPRLSRFGTSGFAVPVFNLASCKYPFYEKLDFSPDSQLFNSSKP